MLLHTTTSTTTLTALVAAVPYAFPNSAMTTSHATNSKFLYPSAHPNTMPFPTAALKPRSTDSICAKPGYLVCSMDGRRIGLCRFAGYESVQWMDVGEGEG